MKICKVPATESSKAKLVKLCPTRWVEQHESLMVRVDPLYAVPYTLQEISAWQDGDSSSSAMIRTNSIFENTLIISL
jgi:hypothetical protein